VVNILVQNLPRDADEWDRLVASATIPTPFARSWWLEALSGPRTQIVHVTDGAELIGGLALQSERILGIELVRLAGHALVPDHCDLLARPGYEAIVVRALAEWFARPGQRRIALEGLAEHAALLSALPAAVATSALDIAPYQRLPADFASYLSTRHRTLRKNISRYRRKMVDLGLRHHVFTPDEAEFGLAELHRLHSVSFGATSTFLPQFDVFARAAKRGIQKGEVVLHAALDGDRAVAVEVVFEVAGRVSTYQTGRDTGDPRTSITGTALLSHAIEGAIERGCREFDMLRGSQDYKRAWADDVRDVVAAVATSGTVATEVQHAMDGLRALKRQLSVRSRRFPTARGANRS